MFWKKNSADQSDLRTQLNSFTSISNLVRAEWLKCWRWQGLLW